MTKLSSYCIKAAFVGFFSFGLLQGQSRITCSSDDGRRNVCRADTRRGVTLVNQISSSSCIQGQTWGYDRRGVWVDRGCRAEFALGRQGAFPGRPGRPQRQPTIQTVSCASENGKRNWCGNSSNGEVRLVKQRSGSRCTRDYSWGTQPGSIWVDKGCRADFEIRSY